MPLSQEPLREKPESSTVQGRNVPKGISLDEVHSYSGPQHNLRDAFVFCFLFFY